MAAKLNRLLVVFYWGAFLLLAGMLAVFMQHYIDFTDQSFHLIYLTNPDDIGISVFLYYYYMVPIFEALGQNLYHYRLFGMTGLLLASLPLGFVAARGYFGKQIPAIFWPVYLLAMLSFYKPFMVVPGYNWFNLIGIMQCLTGMALLIYPIMSEPKRWLFAGLLVGLGGWLSFLAKPPSAALLAIIVAGLSFYLFASKRLLFKALFTVAYIALGAVVMLAAFHFLVVDSFEDYLQRLNYGLEVVALIKSGHGFFEQIAKIIRDFGGIFAMILWPAVFFIPLFLASLFSQKGKHFVEKNRHVSVALFVLTILAGLVVAKLLGPAIFASGGAGVMLLPAALLGGLALVRVYFSSWITLEDKKALIFSVTLIFATYAFCLGSNLHYLYLLNYQGVLLLLIIIGVSKAFLQQNRFDFLCKQLCLPMVALLFIAIWYQAYHKPQRSNVPVYQQQMATQLTDDPKNILYLDEAAHRYITDARAALEQYGFTSDQVIIDMTGFTPLITYIAQATPTPSPWLLGSFPGSRDVVLYILSLLSEEQRQQAWVLTSGEGCERKFDNDITALPEAGLAFPDNYIQVAELIMPWPKQHCQILWKPKSHLVQ